MIIIYWFLFCLFCGIVKSIVDTHKQRKAEKEMERIETLKRLAQIEKYQEQHRREIARRQAEVDRELARQRKEQERQAKEQQRQAKEQQRQAEQLKQATSDIDFLIGLIGNIDAQRDSVLLRQSTLVPGSKEFEKCQAKIISLDRQIHAAETKLNKALNIKQAAQKELDA